MKRVRHASRCQVTSYTYNDVGNKLSETYSDHTANSSIGQTLMAKSCSLMIGRTRVRTDQEATPALAITILAVA